MPKETKIQETKSSSSQKSAQNKNTPTKRTQSPKNSQLIGESKPTRAQKAASKSKLAQVVDYFQQNGLVNKYTKYASTREYKAYLFVKKYLKQAKKNCWVEIIEVDAPEYYEFGYLQFKTVVCVIYERTIRPEYPKRSAYPTKEDYELVCRAIDWDTEKKDIRAQKRKKIRGKKFRIMGVVYLNTNDRPPYFIDSAPDKIKALANDFEKNKTKMWADGFAYINPAFLDYDPYQYKIKKIEQLDD